MPFGIATIDVLDCLSADLVSGTTDGIIGKDAKGSWIDIFMDVYGFLGDCLAAS